MLPRRRPAPPRPTTERPEAAALSPRVRAMLGHMAPDVAAAALPVLLSPTWQPPPPPSLPKGPFTPPRRPTPRQESPPTVPTWGDASMQEISPSASPRPASTAQNPSPAPPRHREAPKPTMLLKEVLDGEAETSGWLLAWAQRLPPRVGRAAISFDGRHTSRSSRVSRMDCTIAGDPTSLKKLRALRDATWEMRRNRFYTVEPLEQLRRYTQRARSLAKWRLEDSIWWPRVEQCDSCALHETLSCERAALATCWREALQAGLGKYILKHDDGDDDESATAATGGGGIAEMWSTTGQLICGSGLDPRPAQRGELR